MNCLGFRVIRINQISHLASSQEDKSIPKYIKMISSLLGNLSKSWESSMVRMSYLESQEVCKRMMTFKSVQESWKLLYRRKGTEGLFCFPDPLKHMDIYLRYLSSHINNKHRHPSYLKNNKKNLKCLFHYSLKSLPVDVPFLPRSPFQL